MPPDGVATRDDARPLEGETGAHAIFNETSTDLRRLAGLLYAIVGPVFVASLVLALRGQVTLHVALVVALILAGGAAVARSRSPGSPTWVLVAAVVPVVSCAIAADALWPSGAAFMVAMGAPVAWAAVLFGRTVTTAAWALVTLSTATVLTLRCGIVAGAGGAVLVAVIQGLVAWVVRGKADHLHAVQESLARQKAGTERSLARHKALVEAIPDTLGRLDREGRFVELHASRSEVLPDRADTLLGRDVRSLVPPDVADAMTATIARAFTSGKIEVIEYAVPYADGEHIFESRVRRVADDELVVIRRDVTPVRKMLERLHHTERLASLGTMSAGIAHEINNPLAYVLSNLEYALESVERGKIEPDALAEALRDAAQGAGRVRDIVASLRMFSKPAIEQPHLVEVREAVTTSVAMVRNQIDVRARLELSLGKGTVRAEPTRLSQVVLNLLTNAVQAIPEHAPEGQVVSVRTYVEGPHVVLEVSDTGAGIPPEVEPHIFEPFFTTKGVGGGMGLGLSVTHGIVSALGGEIRVSSERGKGTTFRVLLPLAREEATAPTSSSAIPAAHRRRVLVIDDEPLVGKAIARTLSEHAVEVAKSATQAIERVRSGQRYEVILCDLLMPVTTGMDVYAAIAGIDSEQASRVAFITGGAFTERAREFLERVPNPRLAKPLDSVQLRALVDGGGARVSGARAP